MFLFSRVDVTVDATKCAYVSPRGDVRTCHVAHARVCGGVRGCDMWVKHPLKDIS